MKSIVGFLGQSAPFLLRLNCPFVVRCAYLGQNNQGGQAASTHNGHSYKVCGNIIHFMFINLLIVILLMHPYIFSIAKDVINVPPSFSFLPAPTQPVYSMRDEHSLFKATPAQVIQKPKKQIPSYGNRQGFVPRTVEDFGDGGAFPEIHVAQYPLDMGRKKVCAL